MKSSINNIAINLLIELAIKEFVTFSLTPSPRQFNTKIWKLSQNFIFNLHC